MQAPNVNLSPQTRYKRFVNFNTSDDQSADTPSSPAIIQRPTINQAVTRYNSHRLLLQQYLIVLFSLIIISASSECVIHAYQPDASSNNGDALPLLFSATWGTSPLISTIILYIYYRIRGSAWPIQGLSAYVFQSQFQQSIPIYLIWCSMAWWIPDIAGSLQYVTGASLGLFTWYDNNTINAYKSVFTYASNQTVLIVSYIYYMLVGGIWDVNPTPASNMLPDGIGYGISWFLFAITEEVGWCLVLYPTLYCINKQSFHRTALMASVVWPSFHLLYCALDNVMPSGVGYNNALPTTNKLYQCVMLYTTLGPLRWIIVFVLHYHSCRWILWPIMIHGVHNGVVASYLLQLPGMVNSSVAPYFIGEGGIIIAICYFAVVSILLTMQHRLSYYKERNIDINCVDIVDEPSVSEVSTTSIKMQLDTDEFSNKHDY